jgi:hypothetical protein
MTDKTQKDEHTERRDEFRDLDIPAERAEEVTGGAFQADADQTGVVRARGALLPYVEQDN